jgi:hypothetical protein
MQVQLAHTLKISGINMIKGSQCLYTNVERYSSLGEARSRIDITAKDRLPSILRTTCRRQARRKVTPMVRLRIEPR